MKHKILSLSIAAMLVGGVSVQAFATPTTQVSENKAKYKELSSQILTLNSQVSDLNVQIENLNKVTNDNDLKMKDIGSQIAQINVKVNTAKQEIEKKQEALGVRVSAMYKSQLDFNPLAFLLSSDNFGDFLSRLNAFSRIISLDDNMINSLLASKKTLDSDVASLNAKEASLKSLQDSTKKNIDELNQKKKEQEVSIAELNEQKSTVLSTIEENENELVSYAVNISNSSSSSLSQLENAISSLKGLLPQLSIESVRNKANQAITTANGAINTIKQKDEAAKQEAAKQAADKIAADKAAAEAEANKNNTSSSGSSSSSGNTNNSNSSSDSGSSSNNGDTSSPTTNYKKIIQVEATAYSGGTITAMGLKPVRNPSGISTIAVDPSVIPLGSKVYIPGYGYAIASDTGGAIKGNKIDLYLNSSQESTNWGRRPVTVYVIAYPGQW